MLRFSIIVIIMIILTSCGRSPGSQSDETTAPLAFIELVESQSVGDRDIQLSDLIESYQIVRFEDSDSAIFKPHKVVLSNNSLLSFREGCLRSYCLIRKGT